MYAVILTVPRVAALRPAAAPAIIKSILNSHNLSSKILDLNIDYFTTFKKSIDPETFREIDEFLFIKNKKLSTTARNTFDNFISNWINTIINFNPKKLFISVFSWQAQRFVEEFATSFGSGSYRIADLSRKTRPGACENLGMLFILIYFLIKTHTT
jgi:hypothetical protein